MAINYLNSVDLNKNYIDNAAIQNLGTEPTADTPGQIYFNTTSQALKVTVQTGFVSGSETYAWEEVGSDSVIAGTGISITPGTGAQVGNSVITNSGLVTLGVVAGSQNWTIANGVNTTTTFASASTNEITIDSPTAGTVRIGLPADVTISNDLTVSNDISVDGEAAVSGASEFTGLVTASAGVAITTGALSAGANTTINLGANRVTNIADPTSAQDAATKAYVDTSVTGLLQFQGGFDANTGTIAGGTTNLTKNDQPNAGDQKVAVAVGDYYVVTADGNFFGNTATPLTVGDSVIVKTAKAAGASVEADFIVVQSDTDLATASAVGLGNVVPGTSATVTAPYSSGTATIDVVDSTASQKGAVIVAPGEGIDVSYSSGTATVSGEDSSATNKGIVIVAGGTGIAVAYSGGTATVSATSNGARQDLLSTDTNVSRTVSGGLTTFALDVGAILGSTSALNVKAEIISAAGQTVYADITRSGTILNVIFTGSVADSAYQALLIDLA